MAFEQVYLVDNSVEFFLRDDNEPSLNLMITNFQLSKRWQQVRYPPSKYTPTRRLYNPTHYAVGPTMMDSMERPSKPISKPMGRSTQSVQLYCIDVNTVSKETEMRFHMTDIT